MTEIAYCPMPPSVPMDWYILHEDQHRRVPIMFASHYDKMDWLSSLREKVLEIVQTICHWGYSIIELPIIAAIQWAKERLTVYRKNYLFISQLTFAFLQALF